MGRSTSSQFFAGIYYGKTVLVTGDTGFKGSWLSLWLKELGAHVIGFADSVPTSPALFEVANLAREVDHVSGDIRNRTAIAELIGKTKPDFIFHLAAQSLVRRAYSEPALTFETNAMGTLNVLEALRSVNHPCTLVSITSDKAYDNVEWMWGYRESDTLGGRDPYSGSKGAAELVLKSYFHSFFSGPESLIRVGIGRAGNVIGGGDWASDRIVPDAVRAWSSTQSDNQVVSVRNPLATRPWQHVLEPLSGYLRLGQILAADRQFNGEPYNFGPSSDQIFSVGQLLNAMSARWEGTSWIDRSTEASGSHEARLLKLNCDKALHQLGWSPTLTFEETVVFTIDWYRQFYKDNLADTNVASKLCREQIRDYCDLAVERKRAWVN